MRDFYLIGIDYKTAAIAIREGLYYRRSRILQFWQEKDIEATMLSTCNRLEVYLQGSGLEDNLAEFYAEFPQFCGYGYCLKAGNDIFRHLLGLASGLESQIKGELEILQQLEAWCSQDAFPPALADLAGRAIFLAQRIRKQSGLDCPRLNLATLVFADIAGNLGREGNPAVIILGTGKIAELFSLSCPKQARLYFVAHRNFHKAKALAKKAQAEAISLEEIGKILPAADIVVSATSSPHFLIRADSLAEFTLQRDKPFYFYDLAIPRDIDPEVKKLPSVFLKDLDGLGVLFEKYNSSIADKLALAEYLCDEAVCTEEYALAAGQAF